VNEKSPVKEFADGDVYFWIEQSSSIHMKAASKGDPVELTANEARKIGEALIAAAAELEKLDEG